MTLISCPWLAFAQQYISAKASAVGHIILCLMIMGTTMERRGAIGRGIRESPFIAGMGETPVRELQLAERSASLGTL